MGYTPEMNPYLRYSLITLGILFLIFGIIGLFLPILQGIFFLLIGFYILSFTSRRLKRTIDAHLSRYPRAKRAYDRYSAKIEAIFGLKKGRKEEDRQN